VKEAFLTFRFNAKSEALIATANGILDEYDREGYTVTLRQLFYQCVARAILPNTDKTYKALGDLVNRARLAGLIDWAFVCDRGRETIARPVWRDPADLIAEAAKQFAIDLWQSQPNHVELMVEKQALEGVLEPVCREQRIRFTANKGYSSASALYEIGKHLHDAHEDGKAVHVLYLGDHDPSGLDMTRDVRERLTLFSGVPVCVHRIALNRPQIEALRPPENPAKTTDTRFADYARQFGSASWELDAIEPRALAALVTRAVEGLRDPDLWKEAVTTEKQMHAELNALAAAQQKKGSAQ